MPQEPPLELIDVGTSETQILVFSKLNKAVITAAPFKIDFYQDNVLFMTVNGKNLLRFEHLRTKPSVLDPNEDPGSWEETFLDVVDTKPNGPEAISLDFTFPLSRVLFGIPEHCETFSLKQTIGKEPYRLFTLDVPGYELDSEMALYGAIPVIYGHGPQGTVGMFWHNSADTFVDIYDTKTSQFITESGVIDAFIFLGPSPNEVFSQYTAVTGHGNLPQLYSLAYHQSRWNYMTQEEVIEVVDNFDKNDIPLDTMWLDIEYTDGKRYFTWNHTAFPTPLEMIEYLKKSNRHLTYIVDPHIFKDENYFFYSGCKKLGHFVKDQDFKTDFEGSCWPGLSSYVEFFNPESRKYYADQYLMSNFKENAIDTGVWNDMNEPSVFDLPEKTMPRDVVHYGGWEHRNVHNMYGHMHVMATYDGLMRRANGMLRPFILTRSFFSGTQRYSAVWTGDNTAGWGYLKASLQMCLSISVSGISFCGSDVGGFFDHPPNDLFTRWYQAASFQPFFRSHAAMGTPRREPYLLPNSSMAIVRDAIKKRYSYLPMWYTLFYDHEIDGKPIMRPMFAEYPKDENLFTVDTQYMLSNILLVCPVLEEGVSSINVRFPSTDGDKKGDIWYDTDDYRKIVTVGNQTIQVDDKKMPVYQRGGSIIPRKDSVKKTSVDMKDDPISLYVALDANQNAHGSLYLDDEMSFDYRRGKFLYLQFDFSNDILQHQNIENATFIAKNKLDKVIIAGRLEKPSSASLVKVSSGETRKIDIENYETYFILKNFDVDIMDNWKIEINASQHVHICGSLLFLVLVFHALKYLIH